MLLVCHLSGSLRFWTQHGAALKLMEHWDPQATDGIKPSHCVLRHSQSFSDVCLGVLAMWQATGRPRCLSNYRTSFLHHMSNEPEALRMKKEQPWKFPPNDKTNVYFIQLKTVYNPQNVSEENFKHNFSSWQAKVWKPSQAVSFWTLELFKLQTLKTSHIQTSYM